MPSQEVPEEDNFIRAVDISRFPEITQNQIDFFNKNGESEDFLSILRQSGVNTVRLRLWVNPTGRHSSFPEVEEFSQTLKQNGFKIWLCLHYSDTWADPGHQETPVQWQGLDLNELKDSVYHYTKKVTQAIKPELVQVGNEINSGFLHPLGHIDNELSFKQLLGMAILGVRESQPDAKIMLHYAGLQGADWFFEKMQSLDYDQIGISYYPIWHGKDLNQLRSTLRLLSQSYEKEVLIAETAYPFTLDWNDWTNNIVGWENHLILPDFPASPEGQKAFIQSVGQIVSTDVPNGVGFCYWGAELVAWKGEQATDASPWENQALFDFRNRALPVLEAFEK